MRTAILAATVAALALALGAVANAGQKDPRLCLVATPKTPSMGCAQEAAQKALIAHQSSASKGHWSAVNIYCKTADPKLLRWACKWGDWTHHASVQFWATSTGWHTRVIVTQ